MKSKYYCPHCNSQLNVGNDIIFTVKTSGTHMGLVLVSPQVGDYSVIKDPLFSIETGEHLEIICPVCHKKLQKNKLNQNLAMVKMIDDKEVESEIYFSEIFGEHCTYKITNKTIEIFGDDSGKYSNFWGAEPCY